MAVKDKFSEKGISLYFSMIVLSIMLAIALSLTVILINQTKMIKSMGDSVIAFYAADSGIEKVLYEDMMCRTSGSSDCSGLPWCLNDCSGVSAAKRSGFSNAVGQANYTVTFDDGANWVESVGEYKNNKRAVRVERQ